MLKSTNPTLGKNTFEVGHAAGEAMTFAGVANKGLMLFAFLLMTFIYSWNSTMGLIQAGQMTNGFGPMLMGGLIGGFILAMVTIFKKEWAPFTAPLYALAEGLVLGSISAVYEVRFGGIVFSAVSLTLGVFFVMMLAYRWGLIRVTEKFRSMMIVAMGAIMLVYLVGFIMSFFGSQIPMIHGNGVVGIGFSVVVCAIASLSLLLDFDSISQGVAARAPKYMEWYSGFALLVTLIWLYLEILRLLSKLRSRD
jgi:uncharacterized YccA/Bax inhibitor family protein